MVDIDQIAREITEAVREYTEDVSDAIEEELDDTSKAILKATRGGSPVKTGDYRRGWKRTTEKYNGRAVYTIWNQRRYRLVHLLEFGHAKRGGGRVPGRPHVGPAFQRFGADMPDRIKRIIRNGGG